jgi:hypothetical protein
MADYGAFSENAVLMWRFPALAIILQGKFHLFTTGAKEYYPGL